jgi:Flp pilus assembly protein TadG
MTQVIRFIRARGAQSIVEMALLAPVFIVLVVGMVDVGRYAQFKIILGNSARAGAEYGSLNSATAFDASGMQTAAKNDAPTLSSLTVTPTYYCTCSDGTTTSCTPTACSSNHRILNVSVTASAKFTPLFKYPFVGGSIVVTRTAIEQVAQ